MDITVEQVLEQISAVTPGNVLLLASLVILTLGLIPTSASGEARRNLWGVLTLFSLGMSAAFALIQDPTAATSVDATVSLALFAADQVTSYGVWLALLSGLLIVLVGWEHIKPTRSSDYYGWLLMMLSGLIYTAGARDLTSLFLGLELVSLPTTVLLGITRSDDSGREAALKYFTLAAFASGFFLLGCSYLYGATGSTTIELIQRRMVEQRTPFIAVALALTLVGLSFRVTAVPFHFYAPDVFSGRHAADGGRHVVYSEAGRFPCNGAIVGRQQFDSRHSADGGRADLGHGDHYDDSGQLRGVGADEFASANGVFQYRAFGLPAVGFSCFDHRWWPRGADLQLSRSIRGHDHWSICRSCSGASRW